MHSILAIFKLRYFLITIPKHGVSGKLDSFDLIHFSLKPHVELFVDIWYSNVLSA